MILAESFDGDDPCIVHLGDGNQTRIDGRAVDKHRTCTARPLAAPFLRTREPAVDTKHIEQTRRRLDVDFLGVAVYDDAHSGVRSTRIDADLRSTRPGLREHFGHASRLGCVARSDVANGGFGRVCSKDRDGAAATTAGDLGAEQAGACPRGRDHLDETIGATAAKSARTVAGVRTMHQSAELDRCIGSRRETLEQLGEASYAGLLVDRMSGRALNRIAAVSIDARDAIRGAVEALEEFRAGHPLW